MPLVDLRPQATRRSPDELVAHLNAFEMDLRFTAGIWFFSPSDSRFHGRYKQDVPLEARLEAAYSLKDYGLVGLEAHYPNEVNEDNLHIWQDFQRDTGIRLVTTIPLLFYDPRYEFGSVSNPDEAVRRHAIDRMTRTFAIGKELDVDFSVIWAGIDGYENPFGMDMAAARYRMASGIAEAMDA
ncbi:MAG: xylose isomerase, partial [Bacteroidota bacterium]